MKPRAINSHKEVTEPGHHDNALPHEISKEQIKSNEAAHIAADRDIEKDAELSTTNNPTDDLDEGELARLGEDSSHII